MYDEIVYVVEYVESMDYALYPLMMKQKLPSMNDEQVHNVAMKYASSLVSSVVQLGIPM
jgi:hypothetical protein